MQLQAIIFGGIGTLVETSELQRNAFNQASPRSDLTPRAGVRYLINKALNTDTRLAIASTTYESNIAALAEASKLDLSHFDVVVHRELVAHRKPHPEAYELCLRALGLKSYEAVAIEDSDSGVQSALDAGLTCFALPGANTTEQEYGQAALVTHSLREVDVMDAARGGNFAPRIGSLDLASCERLAAGIR